MTTSPRPEARRPRLRERSEAAKNSVAPAFNAAWATPTRRGRASVSLQSVNPVIAEPSAPARPRARLASAARAIPEWPGRSERVEEALDGRLQTVGRGIEPILLAEPGGYSARDCRPQAFASRAPHPSPLP